MPTLTLKHEAPLELIRQYPALAAELVAAMTDIALPAAPASVRLGPTDMNNVIPVQFTADSVIVVSDSATGEPALIVIVEGPAPIWSSSPLACGSWTWRPRAAPARCWQRSGPPTLPMPTACDLPRLSLSQLPTLPARF